MMKSNLLAAAGLAVTLGFGASTAFGAPYLYGDEVQLIEDDDAELLLSSLGAPIVIGSTTVISVGNLFAGAFEIQGTQNVPSGDNNIPFGPGDSTFTAIFLLDTTDVTRVDLGNGSSFDTLNFGAATQAQWNSVFGAGGTLDLGIAFDVSNINGGGSGITSGTTALLFNGIDISTSRFTGTSLSDSAQTFVNGGVLQYEIGFTGAAGEFWNTEGVNAALPAENGNSNPTVRFAQNITKQWAGPDLDPHNFLASAAGGLDNNFTSETQFQAKGNLPGGPRGVWPVTSDTDVYFRAVPEPASIALLSLGLLGLGLGSRRMKKAA